MAIASATRGPYKLRLFDGYLSANQLADKYGTDSGLEQLVAEHLHRLGTGAHLSKEARARAPPYPNPLHVWVVGNNNWARHMAEPFTSIAEHETSPDYRIVLVGADRTPLGGQTYLSSWGPWLRAAGLTRFKKHGSIPWFRQNCEPLLETMADAYDEQKQAPSGILEEYGVPLAFYDGNKP